MQVKKTLFQKTWYSNRLALTVLATLLPVCLGLGQGSTLNVVTGNISVPGERDAYTFSLASPGRFYFDALANLPNTLWSLSGPQGVVVTNRAFTASDAQSINDPTLALPVGNYTLTISGQNASTDTYAFRFVDLSEATPATPNTVVTRQLSPANQTDFYKFSGSAGDLFVFQASRSGLQNTWWRLLDPYGNQVFSTGLTTVGTIASPVSLPASGVYTLLVEGYIAEAGSGSYTFNIVPEGHVTPPVFTGTPLTIGNVVSGTFTANTPLNYIFTVASVTRVLFDTQLSSPNMTWTLQGPPGVLVNGRGLNASDSGNGYPLLVLPPGDYQLVLNGNDNNSYQFQLVDLGVAAPLTPGNQLNGTLNPANSLLAYQFNLSSPGKVYYDYLTANGIPNAYVRALDPYGMVVFSGPLNSDLGPVTLTIPGTYVFVIDGYLYDAGGGSFNFNLRPVSDGLQALTMGNLTSGSITTPGQQQQYTFSLSTNVTLYFDSLLNNGNFNWSLDGPTGNLVNRRPFSSSDAQSIGNPLLMVPPGDYTLTIAAAGDNTGAYQFRLFDLASATPLTLGTQINASLNPANSTTAYKFSASAGTTVFYNYLTASGADNAYVRVVDSHGNILSQGSLSGDQGPITLPDGEIYYLLVEGYIGDQGNGTYSFNLFSPTGTVQALSLGTPVNGSIATPGQRQQYTFTSPPLSILYFDSLLNNGNFVWSLDGPTGNVINRRPFSSSDAQSIGNPLLIIPPGDYTLTVSGNGDATGAYQFNLFNLSSASALTLGTPVNGTLNPANSTLAYQFTATPGTKVFYNYLTASGADNAYVRLIDPQGNILMNSSLRNDQGPISLNLPGTYTLLVEGYVGDQGTGSYSFTVAPVTNGQQALTIGSVINGNIASPSQRQQYAFTLAATTRLYFDSLLNNGNFNWSLNGPTGNVVNQRQFTSSDAQSIGNPLLVLPAGDYVLSVAGAGDTIGAFQFKLLDLATATALTLGTQINGTLNPANSTLAYQFTASPGTEVFYNYLTANGADNAFLHLIDPQGNVLVSTGLRNDQGPLTLNTAGNYLLLVEGYIGDQGTGTYSFNLVTVTDASQAATLGTVVNGTIAVPGQISRYLFSVPQGARLFFDALTTGCNMNWRIDGPKGNLLGGTTVNCISYDWFQPRSITPVSAGNYTVTIAGSGDSTGSFAFQLMDFSTSPVLTPSATPSQINGSVSPANSATAWKFSGHAGQQLVLQPGAQSGFTAQSAPRWLLQDPVEDVLFDNWFTPPGPIILPLDGDYVLVVYGWINETGPIGNVSFQIQLNDGQPPTLTGTPLSLGTVVNGTVSPAQPVFYTFSLPTSSRLIFDAQIQNDQLLWSLTNSALGFIINRSFVGSDSADIDDASFALPAGQYQLAIIAASGSGLPYAFQLLNLTNASPMTPGTPVVSSLTPANGTILYQFAGQAGDHFYFDGQPSSGFTYAPNARLYAPLGNILFSTGVDNDADTFTLPQSGNYTLAVEGRIYDNHSTGTYAFNIIPQNYPTNNLVVDTTVTGSLPVPGQRNVYLFSLPAAATLYFDALTNADFFWRLDTTWGKVVDWRSFSGSDSADIGDPSLPLPAGNYVLTVAGNNFKTTGGYQFRLLNFTNATSFTPGTVVSGSLAPANSTVFYKFTGQAGDHYYFDGQTTSGFTYTPQARIYAPLGNLIMSRSADSDEDTFTLPQTGTYTLAIEGRVYDTHASGLYGFNLVPENYPTNSLALNSTVSGSLPVPGQRNVYLFSLPAASTLYFDSLTNADFYWRLDAASGQIVNWRSFSGSDSADIGDPSLPLPAGDYVLTVAGNSFTVTGDYQFRLLNFTNATTFSPGTTVSGPLTPANSTVFYQFTGKAGDHYYFDGQTSSGFTYVPQARIYAPLGNIIMSRSGDSDEDTFTLTQSGTYTLTIEGRVYDTHATGTYAFNLEPENYPTNNLTLNSTVTGSIPVPGQRNVYLFSLAASAMLYFDSLTNADFYWRLDAPWGQVVNWRAFSASDSSDINDPSLQLPPGNYVLTVAGNSFKVTGGYQFRLLDFNNATSFTPGVPVNASLSPADSTVLYKFTANAGDRFYFDGLPSTGFAYVPLARLFAPLGNVIMSQQVNADQDTFTVVQAGTYILAVEGRVYDTNPSGNYGFNLVPNPPLPSQPLYGSGGGTSVPLENPTLLGDIFQFSFTSAPNHMYLVQFTSSLALPVSWQPLTNFVGDGTTFTVTNKISPTGMGFYRLQVQ